MFSSLEDPASRGVELEGVDTQKKPTEEEEDGEHDDSVEEATPGRKKRRALSRGKDRRISASLEGKVAISGAHFFLHLFHFFSHFAIKDFFLSAEVDFSEGTFSQKFSLHFFHFFHFFVFFVFFHVFFSAKRKHFLCRHEHHKRLFCETRRGTHERQWIDFPRFPGCLLKADDWSVPICGPQPTAGHGTHRSNKAIQNKIFRTG